MRTRVLLTVGVFLTITSCPFACSVSGVLTPEELVEQSDLIILALASEAHDIEGNAGSKRIEFQVIDVIKGSYDSTTLAVSGRVDRYAGKNREEVPYRMVRPGGRGGMCYAYDYELGRMFLFIMKDRMVHWAALGPINEEVSGPTDPWLLWVKLEVARSGKRGAVPRGDALPHGDDVVALVPDLLNCPDPRFILEGFTILHENQLKGWAVPPDLLKLVVETLERLLDPPVVWHAESRRLACRILGEARYGEAIPVLLRALEDEYLNVEFEKTEEGRPPGMEWVAVWRDSDRALRSITGENPIELPREFKDVPGQRERVRAAWMTWSEETAKANISENPRNPVHD